MPTYLCEVLLQRCVRHRVLEVERCDHQQCVSARRRHPATHLNGIASGCQQRIKEECTKCLVPKLNLHQLLYFEPSYGAYAVDARLNG